MLSQFLLLPLIAFGLGHVLQMTAPQAISVLVMGCCPGGTTSNIFTYWSEGDVALSICMTCLSTLMALGMMPLNLFIYSRSWTDERAVIPYAKIAIALASTAAPAIVGVFIRHKLPKLANVITKVGSVSGLLVILITLVLQGLIFPEMFRVRWTIFFAAFSMPALGFAFGFVLATIFRMKWHLCRTISMETGAQNVSLAITLVTFTFSDELLGEMILFPSLYGVTVITDSFIFVGIYLFYKFVIANKQSVDFSDKEVDEKQKGDVISTGNKTDKADIAKY